MVSIRAQDGEPKIPQQTDVEHQQWIKKVLEELSKIKPGTRRGDLPPSLTPDGGLSFRKEGRYVYLQCPYIKIDIQFTLSDSGKDFSPNDTVLRSSKPYLEYPTSD